MSPNSVFHNVFSLIISVIGMRCNTTKEACGCIVKFLFKEGRA